jgi:hypothetical protein
MVRNDWTVLQLSCVDKEYAKTLALAKAPKVKVAKLHAVMRLQDRTTEAEVMAWLQPYLGQRLVLKPTHSCAAILYLDRAISPDEMNRFIAYSKQSFFPNRRETQYRPLEHKLLIEENITPESGLLNDYKFACANGHVLHGRVDVGRFTPNHRRALFSVPDFKLIPVRYGGLEMAESVERPAHFHEMVAIAEDLSRGFDFVRIDLYDRADGVYFGEFTFTPCAGSSRYSDEAFAIDLARRLKALSGMPVSSAATPAIDGALRPHGS